MKLKHVYGNKIRGKLAVFGINILPMSALPLNVKNVYYLAILIDICKSMTTELLLIILINCIYSLKHYTHVILKVNKYR